MLKLRNMHDLLAWINMLSVSVFFIWYTIPMLRLTYAGGIYNAAIFFFIGLWFITSILLQRDWILRLPGSMILLTLFLFIIFYYAIFNFGADLRSHLRLLMSFWFIPYLFFFYKIHGNEDLTKTVTFVCFGGLLTTLITTYNGLRLYPAASKVMVNGSMIAQDLGVRMDYEKYISINIGSMDFIYALVISIPIVVFLFKSSRITKWYQKWTVLSILILIILVLLSSGYVTAILLMFLSVILGFILGAGVLAYTLSILGVVTGYLLKGYIAQFMLYLGHLMDDPMQLSRFMEIANILLGNGAGDGDLGSRAQATWASLNTFFNHPFTGAGGIYYSDPSVIGAHSQWADDLGRYGLIGNVLLWGFLILFIMSLYRQYRGSSYVLSLICCYIVVLILGFLNPVFSSPAIGTVIFFLLPNIKFLLADPSSRISSMPIKQTIKSEV